MAALTEQSVSTFLLLARPQLHILSNSPAIAAVARPSANAPVSADVTIVLIMVHILGVKPLTGRWKNALPRGLFPHRLSKAISGTTVSCLLSRSANDFLCRFPRLSG